MAKRWQADRVRPWAILALLLVAFAIKGLLLVPPAPPAHAEFDTERAEARLARVLGDERPHPVDSAADDAVRARLLAELAAIGVPARVTAREDCSGMPKSRTVSCSLTHNVVVVVGGDRPGKALLLNAHYDSTPTGPGAADDGIGVATLLEIAADLRQRPPAQPVVLLFNEGEEFGLNGAAAFAEGDPLADRVGSLINIDARGVQGPGWMFETSEPNGASIAAFATSSRRPYANSLTADFAKLIPNTTDVVVFKHRPWRILNFAMVGNETRYHSPGDTVEALSPSSLYHVGSEVLAATRTLPRDGPAGRMLYADLAGRWLITLPVVAGAILIVGLLFGAGASAWHSRALGRPLAAVAGASLSGVIVAAVVAALASLLRAGDFWRAFPLVSYLAVYATMLAAMLATLRWIGGRIERARLEAATWLLVLLFGALLSLLVHGAIIFFLLAPTLALLGLVMPRARQPLLWAAALLQLVMFGELLASIEMLLVDGPLAAVAPIAALAALPFLVMIVERPARLQAIALTALAISLWIAASLLPRSSDWRPAAFTIDYVRDDGARQAHWAIASKQAPVPDSFARFGKWRRGTLPYNGRTRWLAKAPVIDTPRASVTAFGQWRSGNHRLIRLRLSSGGANTIAIRFDKAIHVLAMGLPGRMRTIDRDADVEPSLLRCSGRSCDGLIVDLLLDSPKPVAARLIATRFGLPPQGSALEALRSLNAIPQYAPDSSVRIDPFRL